MSFWDDIGKAFKDLAGYVREGVSYVVYGVQTGMDYIEYGAEVAWRHTSAAANTVADTLKEVGITISKGVVEGANTAIDFVEKNGKKVILKINGIEEPEPLETCDMTVGKAISAVFLKIAVNGEEYDTFRLLGMACDDKNDPAIKAASLLVADKIGDDIYNIPRVGGVLGKREKLKKYLAWLIYKAAGEKPEMMGGGKAAQATTGLVTVAMTSLICNGRIPEQYPWETEDQYSPDPVDTEAAPVWPEGSRISIDGGIYLILDGKVRHVPDMDTYNNLFENWDGLIKTEHGMQTGGADLTQGAYLAQAHGDTKVYLVNDGVKRWIATPTVLKKYHFNGRAVKKMSAGDLNAIPTGNAIYHFTKKEGSVLKLGGGAGIYLLLDKQAHLIPNPATFNNLFVNWSRIQEVNWESVPLGQPVTDGAYLASVDSKVYLVNAGEKRWIMNPIAFNSFNFDWNKIRKQSAQDLVHLPEGKPIF